MRLKIRCDGECEKFCKIFWEVNKAYEINTRGVFDCDKQMALFFHSAGQTAAAPGQASAVEKANVRFASAVRPCCLTFICEGFSFLGLV